MAFPFFNRPPPFKNSYYNKGFIYQLTLIDKTLYLKRRPAKVQAFLQRGTRNSQHVTFYTGR